MSWTYEQSTGRLLDPDGGYVVTGYAGGNCGKNNEGVNNPDMQDVKCIGPIPRGLYTMLKPLPKSYLGPFAIPLKPDESNEMHGRGSFYMHGDNSDGDQSASEGCIIMPRRVRQECWTSNDHEIEVVA